MLKDIIQKQDIISLDEISEKILSENRVRINPSIIKKRLDYYERRFGISPLKMVENYGYRLNLDYYERPPEMQKHLYRANYSILKEILKPEEELTWEEISERVLKKKGIKIRPYTLEKYSESPLEKVTAEIYRINLSYFQNQNYSGNLHKRRIDFLLNEIMNEHEELSVDEISGRIFKARGIKINHYLIERCSQSPLEKITEGVYRINEYYKC